MPRHRRLWVPSAGAHTISRFVDRRYYLGDDQDRRCLFDAIDKANGRWDWTWLAFAMMSSHVHYGHVAGSSDPDRFFRSAHTRYARQFHRRSGGTTLGPVFADRPSLHPVRESMLPRLVAYLHRNPDRAGVVTRPSHSRWTSHRAYLRLDPAPPWLDVEWALSLLGFEDTAAGRRRFDEFVTEVDLQGWSWDPHDADALRDVAETSDPPDVDWAQLIELARRVTRLPREVSVQARRKAAPVRLLVALVATRDLGQSYAAVGAVLGMTAGAVFNLIQRKAAQPGVAAMHTEITRLLQAA